MKRLLYGVLGILLLAAIILPGCAGPTSTPSSGPPSSTAPSSAPPLSTAKTSPASSAPPASTSQTSAPATSAAAKPIELRVSLFFPGPSPIAQTVDAFDKEIEKRSNGRVKFNFFPGEALLTGPNMVDGVSKGLSEMGYMAITYTPGRFPMTEADTAILGRPSAWINSHVANDVYAKFKPKEWDSFHVFFFNATPPTGIFCKTAVRKMEDLKGKKLRCLGQEAAVGKLLGAETVGTPSTETYDAIAKGVLDGAIYPLEAGKTYRIADATKYFTLTWQALTGSEFALFMNGDTWNKLPADIKSIFDQAASEWVETSAVAWNQQDIVGYQYSKDKGLEFIDLSADEIARWQKASSPILDNYIKEMVGRGFSQQEVQSWIDFIKERRDYWLKKQIDLGIKSPNGPKEIR